MKREDRPLTEEMELADANESVETPNGRIHVGDLVEIRRTGSPRRLRGMVGPVVKVYPATGAARVQLEDGWNYLIDGASLFPTTWSEQRAMDGDR